MIPIPLQALKIETRLPTTTLFLNITRTPAQLSPLKSFSPRSPSLLLRFLQQSPAGSLLPGISSTPDLSCILDKTNLDKMPLSELILLECSPSADSSYVALSSVWDGQVPDLPGQLFAHLQQKVNCACPCVPGKNECDVIQNTQDGAGHEETLDNLLCLPSFPPSPSSPPPSSSPSSNRCRPVGPITPLKCCPSISHVTFLSTPLPPHSHSSQVSKFSQALDPFLWLSGQHFLLPFLKSADHTVLGSAWGCTKLFLDYFLLVPFLSGKTMPDSVEPMINDSAWDRFSPPATDSTHRTQPGYGSHSRKTHVEEPVITVLGSSRKLLITRSSLKHRGTSLTPGKGYQQAQPHHPQFSPQAICPGVPFSSHPKGQGLGDLFCLGLWWF